MKTILESAKKLSKEDQRKITGGDGNEYCFTMQGSYGLCKTSALCNLDLPLCEPV